MDAKTLNFKDFVSSGDRNDLYTFSIGNNSGLNVDFSGAIAAELFTLRNPKDIKRIGKIDFSNLKRKDVSKNLIRVAHSGNANVPQITIASLNSGDYYLRVRSSKDKANYSIAISSPTTTLAPNPGHWFRWIGKSSETPLVSGFRQFGLKMAEILFTQGLQTNNPIQRNQCPIQPILLLLPKRYSIVDLLVNDAIS